MVENAYIILENNMPRILKQFVLIITKKTLASVCRFLGENTKI